MFALFCHVGGEEPDITWSKDGKVLKQSKTNPRLKIDWNISDDTYFLEITDATLEDSGIYKVVLSNSAGSEMDYTEVKVTKEGTLPIFTKKPESVSVEEGEQILLQFQLEEGSICLPEPPYLIYPLIWIIFIMSCFKHSLYFALSNTHFAADIPA